MALKSFSEADSNYIAGLIQSFYQEKLSQNDHKAIDEWIQGYQKSPYAWENMNKLLYANIDLQTNIFASNTLKRKVIEDFDELPPESYDQLRESLLQLAVRQVNESVMKQLCIALVDLSLQMQQKENYIFTLIQALKVNEQALLIVLALLPEELNNSSLRLGLNRRNTILEEFEGSCPHVLEHILIVLDRVQAKEAGNAKLRRMCYESIRQWIKLGSAPSSCLARSPLLMPAFTTLEDIDANTNEHEAATDLVCQAIYLCEDTTRYHELIEQLKGRIYGLQGTFQLMQQAEDIDKCINICRIFTELAETLLSKIVSTPGEGLGDLTTVNLCMEGLSHYDWEVSKITFHFWYGLCESLMNNDATASKFKFLFEKLIQSLTRLCQNDNDIDSPPTGDFQDFRIQCADIVKDITRIVSSMECFDLMFNMLKTESASNELQWDRLEAILWMLSAIAPRVCDEKNSTSSTSSQELLSVVLSQPSATTHPCLRLTSIKLVGDMHDWIDANKENWMEKSIQFLFEGLAADGNCQKDFQTVSAEALKQICTSSCKSLSVHYEFLLSAGDQILDKLIWAAAHRLLQGLSFVISELNLELQEACINQMVGRQALLVQKCLAEDGQPHLPLDRISTMFRYLRRPKNQVAHEATVRQLLPLLADCLNKWQADYRIVERICKCLRFIIRFLGENSGPILEVMASSFVQVFTTHRHSVFLYLTSILVDEIGERYSSDLQKLFEALAGPTLEKLNEEDGLRQNPDHVDDWCRLAARMAEKTSEHFYSGNAIRAAVDSALAATKLDHRDASASVYKFFFQIIDTAPDNIYESLLINLFYFPLEAIVFDVPSYQSNDIAELFFAMKSRNRHSFKIAAENGLTRLTAHPKAKFGATQDQLNHFADDLIRTDSVHSIHSCLRDFCKLYK